MDYKKLAQVLYPDVKNDYKFYLDKYASRALDKDAVVSRIAPSPTGYLHIGTVYQALNDFLLAKNSGGVYYFRLEDTDTKREVENAGDIAFDMLCKFGLKPTEGFCGSNNQEVGNYGPYVQSKRKDIYRAFAKALVEKGRAFPCFCKKTESKQEILDRREKELSESEDISTKDPCRNLTLAEIEENINQGKPFALRLLSNGNCEKTFKFFDYAKGERELRENDKDIVLMKSDGIPPYCFAHLVDDTLMHTSMVIRGEEWFASLPAHLELFDAFGLDAPKYAHTPVICKIDAETGGKRKISKRKDPEADSRYFLSQGYPAEAVIEYLLNLLNSDFEMWRIANPDKNYLEFPYSIEKIGSNNPMFDFAKLDDMSRNYISRLSAERVYELCLSWAEIYDVLFAEFLKSNKEYSIKVFSIDRGTIKPRKDISKWIEVKNFLGYMFEPYKKMQKLEDFEVAPDACKQEIADVVLTYAKTFDISDDKNAWFERVKKMSETLGYATDNKLYKADPSAFKGNVAKVCEDIRLALTGKVNSPDLYSIITTLGKDEVVARLNYFATLLQQ